MRGMFPPAPPGPALSSHSQHAERPHLYVLLLVHALSLVHTHEYRLEEHDELQVVDRLG